MSAAHRTVDSVRRRGSKIWSISFLIFAVIASSSAYGAGLGADCAPRHFIHPNQPNVEKTLIPHHPFHGCTRPVMSDLRQHLIEHDGSQMSETKFPQEFEIGNAAKAA
jgi:hypothetical protein